MNQFDEPFSTRLLSERGIYETELATAGMTLVTNSVLPKVTHIVRSTISLSLMLVPPMLEQVAA